MNGTPFGTPSNPYNIRIYKVCVPFVPFILCKSLARVKNKKSAHIFKKISLLYFLTYKVVFTKNERDTGTHTLKPAPLLFFGVSRMDFTNGTLLEEIVLASGENRHRVSGEKRQF